MGAGPARPQEVPAATAEPRREGSLDAPNRHRVAWEDPDFADRTKTEAEMRRIFDICHGCRRCFNLCDAFPRLFDLIDNSSTGEVDAGWPPAITGRSRMPARCATCAS